MLWAVREIWIAQISPWPSSPKQSEKIRSDTTLNEPQLEEARQKVATLAILNRRQLDDGSIELEVQGLDGGADTHTEVMRFQQSDGQWELVLPQMKIH